MTFHTVTPETDAAKRGGSGSESVRFLLMHGPEVVR